MVRATCVIALGTLVSAGAIVLQWREMVGGGTQTDQIISAANGIKTAQSQLVSDNKQVLADNRQAIADVLRQNREELTSALQQNRGALRAQTSAANGELAAIQKQTEASERPWLDIEVTVDGPLTFGTNEALIPFTVTLTNSGILRRLMWTSGLK
jgi:Spy/CpxP family protein refolding chaperone